MKRTLLVAASVFSLAVVGLSPTVNATKPNPNHKVTICHRTNSVKNAYVKITVDYAAVDGAGKNDHSHHTGPVADSQSTAQNLKNKHQKWGDIIPPVSGVTGGLNWTAQGQAVYNNGCNYVKGGQGGGETPGTVTPSSSNPLTPSRTNQPQVNAPQAGVNAGNVDMKTAAAPIAAFLGSLGSLAYGVIRFRRFGA